MVVTGYTSSYYEVTGTDQVLVSSLPKRGNDYFWDFRQAIVGDLATVPDAPDTTAATQILGYIWLNTPNLTVRASVYQGAGAPAKRGSWVWVTQGTTYEGGFVNYASQYLGNFSTLDLDDTIATVDGLIQYAVPASRGVDCLIADSLLLNLSGASEEQCHLNISWWASRQTYSGSLDNILITRTGQI